MLAAPALRLYVHRQLRIDFALTKRAQSTSSVTVKGPFSGKFRAKHADAVKQGVVTACGGGSLAARYFLSVVTSTTTNWGSLGPDPTPDELQWGILTSLEVVKCGAI